MYFLFKLTSVLTSGFVGIILTLDTVIIYGSISHVFRIFMAIASARLLSSDAYNDVANKIYAVVGVVMLFVLAYAILRAIIDPEQSMKNELGPQLIKRIVIAVIGLAITPVLFNVMYQGQNLFLEHDVLARIFFRGNNSLTAHFNQSSIDVGDTSVPIDQDVNIDEQIKEIGGSVTAVNLWQAFFYPAEDSGKTADEIEADPDDYFLAAAGYGLACAGTIAAGTAIALNLIPGIGTVASILLLGATVYSCANAVINSNVYNDVSGLTNGDKITLTQAYAYAAGGGSFGIFTAFLDSYVDDGDITYLFGFSTAAGIFALYAFVSFSIDMGIRAAKLAYYQIIAPVPLIMQVLPSFKSNFSQYIKSVISTFMEVFIRISVVYIVVYIICHLTEMFSSVDALWGNQNLSSIETLLALALLILGLIAFARSAPKFIADSLGIKSGDMKLGIGKKFAEGGGFAAKAITGAGVRTAVQNWNKNKGANVFRRAASTLAGGFSAAARSAYDQFGPGDKHQMAMNNEQAKRVSGNANEAAYQAGVNRDERQKQNATDRTAWRKALDEQQRAEADYSALKLNPAATQAELDEALSKVEAARKATQEAYDRFISSTAVGTATNDAYKKAMVWATGTIDTSKMDRQVKLFNELAGLKSQLEGTVVDKEPLVKEAQDKVNDLARTDVADYAYNIGLRRRAEERQNNGDTRSLETIMDELRSSSFKRSDFVLDKSSADYDAAYAQLQKDRRDADDNLKAAKKDAVARKLIEATAGIDNDTSRALKSFFETHQQELDTYRDVLFNGQQSLGDYITENFGSRALNGVVDFNVMNRGIGDTRLDLKNGLHVDVDTSGDTIKYTIRNANNSIFVETLPDGSQVTYDGVSEADFKKYISSSKTEVKGSTTTARGADGNVKLSESKASAMKTTAEVAEQEFRDSDTYRNAKSQERAQKESKK